MDCEEDVDPPILVHNTLQNSLQVLLKPFQAHLCLGVVNRGPYLLYLKQLAHLHHKLGYKDHTLVGE